MRQRQGQGRRDTGAGSAAEEASAERRQAKRSLCNREKAKACLESAVGCVSIAPRKWEVTLI